ncbi:MAG: TetR/AcrR family transcriptional regulator [Emcibacter sp.]|nr:TetR/AcrR family transcriptional regulator [Emcibacter sp.]
MVRKAHFDDNDFILAAIELISQGGPAAATMAAIAKYAGAPTGSIYHRFKSRTTLLGAAWLHCLSSMTEDMLPLLGAGHSDDAITTLIDWTEENPAKARLIMLYAQDDLIDGEIPTDLHKKLNSINKALGAGLSGLLNNRGKALSAANLALVNFAIFDGPIAAMKPYLRLRQPSPPLKCREAALACGRASLELLD